MDSKVTIVIPAYNAAMSIKRTVESVKSQTYSNWELLIVNDGSKDDTGRVIDEISQGNEKIMALHQENGGEIAARRTGVLHASGEWVMFVDADDVLPTTSLESLIKCDVDADILVGTMHIQNFKPNGVKFEDYFYQNKNIGIMSGVEYVNSVLLYNIHMSACGKLYKRSIFDKFPWCLDRTIKQNPDLLMNVGLGAFVNKVFVCNESVYEYMIHEGTASSGVMPFENWMRLFDEGDKYIALYENPEQLAEAYFHYRMERFDCMLRHGHIGFSKDDLHVKRIIGETGLYHLNSDEKKVKYLLQSMILRRVFNWWQTRKLQNATNKDINTCSCI